MEAQQHGKRFWRNVPLVFCLRAWCGPLVTSRWMRMPQQDMPLHAWRAIIQRFGRPYKMLSVSYSKIATH